MEKALALLAQALAGPRGQKYRVTSHSRPGLSYELQVEPGGDVTCTCPGFEYRGQCSHARELKAALGKGKSAPGGYEAVAA